MMNGERVLVTNNNSAYGEGIGMLGIVSQMSHHESRYFVLPLLDGNDPNSNSRFLCLPVS
jgi:hypothetical protein